jgi:hypothetical protein
LGITHKSTKLQDIVKNQIKALVNEGCSVVINRLGEKAVVIPTAGRTEHSVMMELRYDRSKLYH